MKTRLTFVCGLLAAIFALAFIVLPLAGCDDVTDPGKSPSTKGSITGKAYYTNGGAHGGITMTLERSDSPVSQAAAAARSIATGSRSITSQTKTADDGLYTFTGIAPGTYTVYASSPDSLEKAVMVNVTLAAGSKSVTVADLNLTPVGSIAGRVALNNQATGNSGFFVCVVGTSYMAITDDEGSFTISGVPAGKNYLIIITKGSYVDYWSMTAQTVTGGETTTLATKVITADDINTAQVAVTIGSNGNWFIDGIDTGIPAQGQKGDKGDTGPKGGDGTIGSVLSIGSNGNWYINGVDTGVKAQGPKGDDGASGTDITIGDNDNWFFNGIDTGIRARFSITTQGLAFGTLTSNKAKANIGETVVLTATAQAGYEYLVNSIRIRDTNNQVAVANSQITVKTLSPSSTTFTFAMPQKNIVPTVQFVPEGTPPGPDDGPGMLFSNYTFYGSDLQLYGLPGWQNENTTQPQEGGMGQIGTPNGPPAFTGGTAHNNHTGAMFLGPNWAPRGGGISIVMISPAAPESDEGFISLNSIDALQLYVRSSGGPITISYVGFGATTALFSLEPLKYAVRYAGEDNTGIVVGNEWQKIVVPLPKRVNAMMSEAFTLWVDGNNTSLNGKTLYLDDIELIAATVAISTVVPKVRVIPYGTATPLATLISGLKVVYTVGGGTPISLYNGRVDFNAFHTVSHSATGGTIQGINFTPDGIASTAYTFTVTVDGKPGTMNGMTSATDWVVLESMLNKGRMTYWWDDYPNSTTEGVAENYQPSYLSGLGYTHASWYAAFEDYTDAMGTYDVLALVNRQWGSPAPGGGGWQEAPGNRGGITKGSGLNVNVAGCTALTTTAFADAAGTVRFTLNPGGHLASVPVIAGKTDINIPVSTFSGTGTWTNVTGWTIEWTSGVAPTPATVYDNIAFVYITEVRLIK